MDVQKQRVCSRLIGLVNALLGPDVDLPNPFPVERRLSDLGISSVKIVDLMLAVEAEFDMVIPETDITPENFHCVASIEALVERTLSLGDPV
ncbi:MAG: phosphopantetheine-binding protein [Steroidobacteraceae bacterium]